MAGTRGGPACRTCINSGKSYSPQVPWTRQRSFAVGHGTLFLHQGIRKISRVKSLPAVQSLVVTVHLSNLTMICKAEIGIVSDDEVLVDRDPHDPTSVYELTGDESVLWRWLSLIHI